MNMVRLKEGMVVKNYKELCSILCIDVKSGSSKKSQISELERYVRFHKEGNKFVIDEIYDTPKLKRDGRILGGNMLYEHLVEYRQIISENKGVYYVYYHYIGEELIYIGKGINDRCLNFYDRCYCAKDISKIDIVFFDSEIKALAHEESEIGIYKNQGLCKYNDVQYKCGHISDDTKNILFPKKIKKISSAYELLDSLGYSFDEHKGWSK